MMLRCWLNGDIAVPEPNRQQAIKASAYAREDRIMGRGILLWLLGVPIPVIILLALIWH